MHCSDPPTHSLPPDLPGYGFAKTSKGSAASWLGFTKDYFLQRDALVAVLLLVDGSIPPQPLDLECADWLGESEVRAVAKCAVWLPAVAATNPRVLCVPALGRAGSKGWAQCETAQRGARTALLKLTVSRAQVPFAVVFTKTDAKKKSGPGPSQNMGAFKKALLEVRRLAPGPAFSIGLFLSTSDLLLENPVLANSCCLRCQGALLIPPFQCQNHPQEWEQLPQCFATSSKEGKGKSELLGYLASLRKLDAAEGG